MSIKAITGQRGKGGTSGSQEEEKGTREKNLEQALERGNTTAMLVAGHL